MTRRRQAHPSRFVSHAAAPATLVLALLAASPVAAAFELLRVEARRDGPAYLLHIEARFDAPPEQLLDVLTDYERIKELHPRMVESRSLGLVDASTEEVYLRVVGCVLFFCQDVHRVERITVDGHSLTAIDVPGRSSFTEGRTRWQFEARDGGALLRYESRFVPGFPVAPVLGEMALAREVERMVLETMAEVERRALNGPDAGIAP
jgi:hypothetical protein